MYHDSDILQLLLLHGREHFFQTFSIQTKDELHSTGHHWLLMPTSNVISDQQTSKIHFSFYNLSPSDSLNKEMHKKKNLFENCQ